GQQRPGRPMIAALEDPRRLHACEHATVVDGERGDLRNLPRVVFAVTQTFAGLCPCLPEIRTAPDARAEPLARGRRIDRPARTVVDRVINRPPFAKRSAELPLPPIVVAFHQETALTRADQQQRPRHALSPPRRLNDLVTTPPGA